ncbi:MAG: hypothetical protein Q7T03_10985 [Deltaproteobacteria bacterium]|nr:hypothetical protein [Deltaproteobacteria bacterium]
MSGASFFAATFTAAGTQTVPAIFSSPPVETVLPSLLPPDLFTAAPVVSPSFSLSPHPISLSRLKNIFAEAREARKNGQLDVAADRYSQAFETLSSLYRHLPNGGDLLTEALFESVVLSGPSKAPEHLNRLAEFAANPPPGHEGKEDQAKVKLLTAFTLMGHVRQSAEPSLPLLERAEKLTEETQSESVNIHFFSSLLKIEILAHQLLIAHSRRDFRGRDTLAKRMGDELSDLNLLLTDLPDRKEIVARCYADTARLFARLGLWGPSLEKARTVTVSPFDSTSVAVKELLTDPIFAPFVDGSRFLTPGEIRLRAKGGQWKKRFQAALALAHTRGLVESLRIGAAGLVGGMVVDAALQGGHGVFAGAAGATAFILAKSIANGWNTNEALYASEVGTFDRTPAESAKDAASLVVQSGLNSFAWAFPAALLHVGTDGIAVFHDTLERAFRMYFSFGRWIGSGFSSLPTPNFSSMDFSDLVYNTYTKAAGLLFALNLLSPSLRKHTDRLAFYFLPGALLLSADIGMAVSGQSAIDFTPHFGDPHYWSRVERVSIVAGEIFFMMLTSGILALDKKTPGAVLSVFHPRRANYMLPMAAVITNGMTSAIGGMMQKSATPDHLSLIALQGAAITVGILPITLGLSGVLKGNIPIGAGVREGWTDSRGENIFKRVGAAAGGGIGAFNMPYSHNRVFRSVTWDLPAAGLRTLLGWDTNPGQLAMTGTNFVAGNGTATATWPETGGTRWERDSLSRLTLNAGSKPEVLAQLDDFFAKVGKVIHPMHPFLGHASLSDRLWPLRAVTRPIAPPQFPQKPNAHFFASLDQMLHGGTVERLDAKQVSVLLEYVELHAGNPDSFYTLRPLVQVLAAARDSVLFGKQINTFFDARPGLFDLFNIDSEEQIPFGRSRLQRRKYIRDAVAEKFFPFEKRVKAHRRVAGFRQLMEGLFIS